MSYPAPHNNPTWHNPDRVEELKRLWAAGLSASQIAGRLGGVTRNSVISKVHRLGLAGRATTSRITNKSKKWKLPPPSKPTFSPAAQVLKDIRRDGLPIPPPAETDIPRVTWEKLTDKCCRWVCVDDPREVSPFEPIFCGEEIYPGLPYCENHARRAYAPPQQQRRREFRIVAGNESVAA